MLAPLETEIHGEDCVSRPAQAESFYKTPSQKKKLGVVVQACHSSYFWKHE
jgi:hypothetical protein